MICRAFKSDRTTIVSSPQRILCVPHRFVSSKDPLDPECTSNEWLYWIADPWSECILRDIDSGTNVFQCDISKDDLVFLCSLRVQPLPANKDVVIEDDDEEEQPSTDVQPSKPKEPAVQTKKPAVSASRKRGSAASTKKAAPQPDNGLPDLNTAPNQTPIAPEKRTTRSGDRTMRYSRLQSTSKKGKGKGSYPKRTTKTSKTGQEAQQRTSALYNNELLYRLNKFEVRPLFEFGRSGGMDRLGADILRAPMDCDPTLILRELLPDGLLVLENDDGHSETAIRIPSWVYEYFEYDSPGKAYLGYDSPFYVWYPLEVEECDAEHYRTYLSVVSRIDYIERLIRDRRLTGNVRREFVNIQNSLIELTIFMSDSSMFTDRELLCPMWPVLGHGRIRSENLVLPSGRIVCLQLANDSPNAIEAARVIRDETTRMRLYGKELGIDWKSLPKDGTYLGEYGQDYASVWHLGLVPDLSAFVEFVGMTGQRDKHDIPFDDPVVRDIIDILQKACPSPLSRRDCSGLLRGKIRDKPLLYSIFYKMTIASLCGFYNMERRATSFYLRSAVWRNFILDECDPDDFLSWMNAQKTMNVAGLAESELFHKQLTMLSIISEYFFFLIKSMPQVYEYMTNNFYGARIIQNLFDAMDEFRATMDNCLFGESTEWEHFQNNNELYAMYVNDKAARTKLSAAFNSPFTEYDAHFSNITGSKYDQTCFLPNSMMYVIIRFLVESLFQYTELFDLSRVAGLRKYLEVPYLWVCRGGDERDTIESIIVAIAYGQISVYSGTIALAIRSRVLLIPERYRDNNEGYTRELMCQIFSCILQERLATAHGKSPWTLFNMPSFEWVLQVYCGPRRSVWTDYRGEFYRAHGVQVVWSKTACRCSCCRSEYRGSKSIDDPEVMAIAARLQYRRFQEMHSNNELAEFFFGHRVSYISETMLDCAYHYRLLYMYRIAHVPFVQHVVPLMEGIMLDLKDTPRMQRISAAITEEERRLIALLVAASDPSNIGLWPLLDPPLQCDYRNILQLIRAKNLYTTNTSTSHVKTVLDTMAAECGRDFLIVYLFFNELFIRQSTRFFALPLSWTRSQIKAIKTKFAARLVLPDSKLSRRIGMYYYCKIHGDFKAPLVTRRCGELMEYDPQYQTSIGTTNFAVNPDSSFVYCRTTAINPGKYRPVIRSAISLPGTTTSNHRHEYGAAAIFEDYEDPAGAAPGTARNAANTAPQPTSASAAKPRIVNGTKTTRVTGSLTQKGKQRRSKMTRLQSLNNMCIHRNECFQMIGNMLVTYNRRIILCPRCATPMVFNRAAFDAFGLNCGQCTLAMARALPTRLSDFMMFTCTLCARRSKYYSSHDIHCLSVRDDTDFRHVAQRDIYLCASHFATVDLERHLDSMTISMFKKAVAGELVFIKYVSEDQALTFGLMATHTMVDNLRFQGQTMANGRPMPSERIGQRALITYGFRVRRRIDIRKEYADLDLYRYTNEYE